MRSERASASRPERYDVIVIGAGPTGLTLANLLGLEGVSTLVVERNPTTVTEPRAVSIDDESLRTMQAAGLLGTVMEQVVQGYGSRYFTPGGRCFLTVRPSGRPYGHPRRNAFRQPVLEQQLRSGLARFDHVRAMFGWRMIGFSQDGASVTVQIQRNGEVRSVCGSYLVGSDGAGSLVRKRLGIPFKGETLPERWLIVDLENSPAERDTLVFCDFARPCIALPGPGLTRRFEFKLFPGEDEDAILSQASVDGLLQSRGAAEPSRLVRKTVYAFHARIADRWSHGPVFLAGDAAHLTPPFAGQGMNSGIRDAHNLAWKLAAVVRKQFAPALLDTYEVERRSHVASMIDLAQRMGRIMGPNSRLEGRLTQAAFGLASLWPGARSYLGEMRYKPRPYFKDGFLLRSRHPLVGRLLPQPRVRHQRGGEGLLDDMMPAGFVLLGIGMTPARLAAATRDPVWGAMGAARAVLGSPALGDRTPIPTLLPLGAEFSSHLGEILLIRPDRYVMAAFVPGEASRCAARVAKLIAQGSGAVRGSEVSTGRR